MNSGENEILRLIVAADFGAGEQADRDRLAEFVAADPEAHAQSDDAALLWDMLGELPPPPAYAAVAPTVLASRAGWRRWRTYLPRSLAASFLGLIAFGATIGLIDGSTSEARAYSIETAKAERRVAQLPDGSTIELAAQSRAEVRFAADVRRIALTAGEAVVRVRPGSGPIVIDAAGGAIRLDGAVNIKLVGGDVQVTAIAGHATVSVGTRASRQSVSLASAHQLYFGDRAGTGGGAVVTSPRRVDVASTLDWTRGWLEFRGERLGDVIDEANRYATGHAVLLDQREADTPIYGMLHAGDLDGLASMLADRQSARGRSARVIRIDAAAD